VQIRVDDLRGPQIAALLEAHLENSRQWSPACSIHALDLERLRVPQITMWTAWDGDTLLGCGALKELDAGHGEIKSMHTSRAQRRRGVAAALLGHIIDVAHSRGYRRLSLETGSQDAFAPARVLYARFGFNVTGPFVGYTLDPNSCYMTLELA
jgi:putative acetyltransferase